MATITTRAGKGSPLTHAEVDANFTNINTEASAALPKAGGTMTGDISMGDSVKAKFGASDDLQIYHDGTNSYIDDTGTGGLNIRGHAYINLQKYTGETMALFNADGAVQLRYDNATKFATTSTGIDVTGNATFADNGKAIFGAGSDLQIYHDGSASYITENGTGSLFISGTNMWLKSSGGDTYILCNDTTDTVSLYQANSKRLETTTTGATITGSLDVTDAATTRTNLDVDQAGEALAFAIALG